MRLTACRAPRSPPTIEVSHSKSHQTVIAPIIVDIIAVVGKEGASDRHKRRTGNLCCHDSQHMHPHSLCSLLLTSTQ